MYREKGTYAISRMICLLMLVLMVSSPVLADKADRRYKKAAKKYYQLIQDTPFRKQTQNWLNTIKEFERIFETWPKHRRAPDSLFNIGKLYRSLYTKNQEVVYLNRSNISFRQLTNQYPDSSLSDDAQLLLAENYEKYMQDEDLAFTEYERLVERYPNSDQAKIAREKLEQLRAIPTDRIETPIETTPTVDSAISPTDLDSPRFGGLSEEEHERMKTPFQISAIDYWSTSEWSRLIINVKDEVRYKYQGLKANTSNKQEPRIFLDIMNSYLPKDFENRISSDDGLIKQARVGQFDRKTVRIVLDLASLEKVSVFHMKLPNQYKIVIDLLGKSALEIAEDSPTEEPVTLNDETLPKLDEIQLEGDGEEDTISLSKVFGLKVKRIVIDPGHGGRDPGALAFGVKEKDLALKMGLILRKTILENHPDIEVLMTRDKDVYLSLEERTAFANKHEANLFISIHLNASPKEKAHGIETYFLNLTTDHDALALAAKENQTSKKSISDLQNILNDLLTNTNIKESSTLARYIQESTVSSIEENKYMETRNLGVKKAPFFVLLGTRMPSVLVESGFITNRNENKRLRNKKYQRALVRGIYKGIEKYMN